MKHNRINLFLIFCFKILFLGNIYSQTDSINKERGSFSFNFYFDSYYGYHFNRPLNNQIPYFVSSNLHNQPAINLAFFQFKYSYKRFKTSFTPAIGSYMNANYVQEKGILKNVYEASIGFEVYKRKGYWIDFGILNSPFSNETPISKDQLMYTRSLAPEYVPYFITGIKATLPIASKINLYLYLINGWQQIKDQNKSLAFASQLEYTMNATNLINWNLYIGDERSSILPNYRSRYFSDIYWICKYSKKINWISSFYAGLQNQENPHRQTNWWQLNSTVKYNLNSKHSIATRFEYFNDSKNTVASGLNGNSFKTNSIGACYTYAFFKKAMVRLDARYFTSSSELFTNQSQKPSKTSFQIFLNFTFWM